MIVPVILCGGSGTRLWPASRDGAPKPFLPLVDGASTFALTLARVSDPSVFGPALVVSGASHRALIEAALNEAKVNATVLIEPAARDTAAAIAAAASFVVGVAPDATLLVLPADHIIRNADAFVDTVMTALPTAESGRIVVFGVKPTGPSAAFGYIKPGARLTSMAARAVDSFVEKPEVERAKTYISAGYLWNSGIFLMGAATAVAEVGKHAPAIATAAKNAAAFATVDGDAVILAEESFASAPKASIDYAVMEKTKRAAVVEAAFDWSDLGTWSSVWDADQKSVEGNVAAGDVTFVNAHGNLVRSDRYKVGLVGVENLVVIASEGALLVTDRAHTNDVKDLVAAIDARPEAVLGDFIPHMRPWGYYQSLDVGTRHQVKRIVVNPGQRLSLQKHTHRAEHWTVVEGVADVTVGMDRAKLTTKPVKQGEHVFVPQGAIHRMGNSGTAPMTLIEVQVGDYLGEDDIVRLEDDYGR